MQVIREAETGDIPTVVGIIRAGFPESLLPYTIMGATGYDAYLRERISCEPSGAFRMRLSVAGGHVQGLAEWHISKGAVHLNNLFVDENSRGQGIGTSLLHDLSSVLTDTHTLVTMHAFADNLCAVDWYRSLGLREIRSRYWTLLAAKPRVDAQEVSSSFLGGETMPSAGGQYERFGFDQVVVNRGDCAVTVGRLGHGLLRYVSDSPESSELLWLHEQFPSSRILVLSNVKIPGLLLGTQIEFACKSDRLISAIRADVG